MFPQKGESSAKSQVISASNRTNFDTEFIHVFQVVTLSLYAYFFSALLGRQFIERTDVGGGKYEEPDMYFPFFTALQVRALHVLEKKRKEKTTIQSSTNSRPTVADRFNLFVSVLLLRGMAESSRGIDQSIRRGRRRHRVKLADWSSHQGTRPTFLDSIEEFPFHLSLLKSKLDALLARESDIRVDDDVGVYLTQAGYMIVDEMHEEHPELLKDQYWDEVVPKDLPYTVASEQYRREEPKGSAEHYKVKESDALYANVMLGTQIHNHVQHRKTHQDDMYADYVSACHQMNLKPLDVQPATCIWCHDPVADAANTLKKHSLRGDKGVTCSHTVFRRAWTRRWSSEGKIGCNGK